MSYIILYFFVLLLLLSLYILILYLLLKISCLLFCPFRQENEELKAELERLRAMVENQDLAGEVTQITEDSHFLVSPQSFPFTPPSPSRGKLGKPPAGKSSITKRAFGKAHDNKIVPSPIIVSPSPVKKQTQDVGSPSFSVFLDLASNGCDDGSDYFLGGAVLSPGGEHVAYKDSATTSVTSSQKSKALEGSRRRMERQGSLRSQEILGIFSRPSSEVEMDEQVGRLSETFIVTPKTGASVIGYANINLKQLKTMQGDLETTRRHLEQLQQQLAR